MHEKKLIEKTLQGDEEAFQSLSSLYRLKIYHHCLGVVKDAQMAEDITQEAFLQAYRHLGEFKMKSSFYTWLFRIAHNLSLNYIKKRARRGEGELKEELHASPVAEEENDEERRYALQGGLERLSPKQRIVFEMADLQGMPHQEIASLLHIAPGTVRSRLHYARAKIRQFLLSSSKSLR